MFSKLNKIVALILALVLAASPALALSTSQAPTNIPIPWANSASAPYITATPTLSQIGITPGRASFTDGFPPLNFQPVSSGGIPPFGADFNGILNQISAGLRWVQAGYGVPAWNSTYSSTIGGYPLGAFVQSATSLGQFWLSTVENNASNPDAGGANWNSVGQVHGRQNFTANGSFTVPVGVFRIYRVKCWGAGGGGGQGNAAGDVGTGGGGGEYREGGNFTVTPGQVLTVTVGVGGAAGVVGTGYAGQAGTGTGLGALIAACNGGAGGQGSNGGGIATGFGTGGTGGTGGDLALPGSPGGYGGNALGSNAFFITGAGGGTWGAGGPALNIVSTTSSVGGSGGPQRGVGGSGSANGGTAGAGAPGLLVVEW